MADEPTIADIKGRIASGNFTEADMSAWFEAGGSPEELMRMMASATMAQQVSAAGRTQEEQMALRQALLRQVAPTEEGGAYGPSAIQQLFNPQSFNSYAGPQTMPGSPFANVNLAPLGGITPPGGGDGGGYPPMTPLPGGGEPLPGGGTIPPGGGIPVPMPPLAGGPSGMGAPAGAPPAGAGAGAGAPSPDVMANLKAFLAAIKGVR